MFGIDGPEFVIILIVLIVVIGPKDLPKMLKAFGKVTSQLRKTANDFRRQFNDAMRDAELGDIQKTVSDFANFDPRRSLTKNFTSVYEPLREAAQGLKSDLEMQNILKGSPKIVDNAPTDNVVDDGVVETATATRTTASAKTKTTTKKTTAKKISPKTISAKATTTTKKTTNTKSLPKTSRKKQS